MIMHHIIEQSEQKPYDALYYDLELFHRIQQSDNVPETTKKRIHRQYCIEL